MPQSSTSALRFTRLMSDPAASPAPRVPWSTASSIETRTVLMSHWKLCDSPVSISGSVTGSSWRSRAANRPRHGSVPASRSVMEHKKDVVAPCGWPPMGYPALTKKGWVDPGRTSGMVKYAAQQPEEWVLELAQAQPFPAGVDSGSQPPILIAGPAERPADHRGIIVRP